MAKLGDEPRVVPSLLDRLIASDPDDGRDGVVSRSESVAALRRAVQRDLEALLNTRNPLVDLPEAFSQTARSALNFGLPDFSGLDMERAGDRDRLRVAVEEAIRVFEPRLTSVRVTVRLRAPADRAVHLRLDARLVVQPTPEPVSFDIVVPLHTVQRYDVNQTG